MFLSNVIPRGTSWMSLKSLGNTEMIAALLQVFFARSE